MISFIMPYASKDVNLYNWKEPDHGMITLSTILAIKNINKTFSKQSYEIILVDNTNTFPNIKIPNVRVVKGLQYKEVADITIKEKKKYNIYDKYIENLTMWVSTAYNIGIEHAKGEYIILQHNDIYYHSDMMNSVINLLNRNEYVTIDYKKVTLTGYLCNKKFFDNLGIDITIGYQDGGYLKTKEIGMADAYFFACKKSFFDDYIVDYEYGDTNHGATIKCLKQNKPMYHIGPYYENPNYKSEQHFELNLFDGEHVYSLDGMPFITHLKGGFSENKLSFKVENNKSNMDASNSYMKNLIKKS